MRHGDAGAKRLTGPPKCVSEVDDSDTLAGGAGKTANIRVGIYARISTRRQEEMNQLLQLRAFVARQDGWEIAAEYVDRVSGSGKKERPQFDKIMLDASKKKFDLLLFWSLDRFSRQGIVKTIGYMEQLKGWNVGWRSYTQPFLDTGNEMVTSIVLSVLAAVAKQERITISERTLAALVRARKGGKVLGRPRPEIDLARVQKLRREGMGLRGIAADAGVAVNTLRAVLAASVRRGLSASMSEKKQRQERLRNRESGSWGTASATYFHSVQNVFHESEKAAADSPAGSSPWVYVGLPVLMAGFEAFLIEHQRLLKGKSSFKKLAGVDGLREVLNQYQLPDELRLDIEALVEVRNQIIHPAQVPFGKPEWPKSLQRLRDRGVLDGNMPQSGTDALDLLAKHRLLEWAAARCAEALDVVADSDPERAWMFHESAGNLWRVIEES